MDGMLGILDAEPSGHGRPDIDSKSSFCYYVPLTKLTNNFGCRLQSKPSFGPPLHLLLLLAQ